MTNSAASGQNSSRLSGDNTDGTHEITILLREWRLGDKKAADLAFSAVYKEIRRLSAWWLQRERKGNTLSPTALAHEVYLRLIGGSPLDIKDRSHFFAVVAQQVRRLLVEHARKRNAMRRGGNVVHIDIETIANAFGRDSTDVIEVHEALSFLEKLDPRAARITDLRLFAGLEEQEIAESFSRFPRALYGATGGSREAGSFRGCVLPGRVSGQDATRHCYG